MAFFRKWKTHYKHKKFTSDADAVDAETWGVEGRAPIKEIQNIEDMKLYMPGVDDEIDADDSKTLFETYEIKYLGCTPIETKRSEKATSEAIKTVIANAKAGGRKSKTHKRVKVILSQNGIEVLDSQTQDTLMQYSIYKVSYCSVDAAHDHTFSFVASEQDPITLKEKLSCHVFECPKRKIAHEITLMVARCFEHAYQLWRDTVVQQTNYADNNTQLAKTQQSNNSNINNNNNNSSTQAVIHHNEASKENLLIDLAVTADNTDTRKYIQNAWVNFEDDGRDSVHIMAF